MQLMRVSLEIIRGDRASDLRAAYHKLCRHYAGSECSLQSAIIESSTLFKSNESLNVQQIMSTALLGDRDVIRIYPMENFGVCLMQDSSSANKHKQPYTHNATIATPYTVRGVVMVSGATFFHYTLHEDGEADTSAWVKQNILSVNDVGALKRNMSQHMCARSVPLCNTHTTAVKVVVHQHDNEAIFLVNGTTQDVLSQTLSSVDGRMKMRVCSTNDGLHLKITGVAGKIVASMYCKQSWFHPHVQILSSGTQLTGTRRLFSAIQKDLHSSIPMYRVSDKELQCCMPKHTCDLSQAISLISTMNLRGENGRALGKLLKNIGVLKPLDHCHTPDVQGVSCFDNSNASMLYLKINTPAVEKLQTAGFCKSTIANCLQAAISVDVHNSTTALDRLIVLTSTCGMCHDEYVRQLVDTIVAHGAHDHRKLPVYYEAHLPKNVKCESSRGVLKLTVVAHDIVCCFDNETDQLRSVYVGNIAHQALASVVQSKYNQVENTVTPEDMSRTLAMVQPQNNKFSLHGAALRLVVINNLALTVPQLTPLHRTLRALWFSTEMNRINSDSSATHCAYVHTLSTLAKMPLESNNLWATLPRISSIGVY